MKERKILFWVMVVSILLFVLLYFLTRNVDLSKNQTLPWQSYVNEQGATVVFGLTMGSSNLTDAMHLFGTEVEASLFEDKDKTQSLEAFFSNTKIGGIGANVILNLILDKQHNVFLNKQIKTSMLMPSGTRKTTFNLAAESAMLDLKIESLTFVPKADLSTKVIEARFGKPDGIDIVDENRQYWYYANKGLRLIVNNEHQEILEFYND